MHAGTDLTVAKSAAIEVKAGEYLTYTIVVNNLGPSPAANVVVTDILPAAILTTTVAFTPTTGSCTQTNNQIV